MMDLFYSYFVVNPYLKVIESGTMEVYNQLLYAIVFLGFMIMFSLWNIERVLEKIEKNTRKD